MNHFNNGNQYAKKSADNKALANLNIRIKQADKALIKSALIEDETLSSFVLSAAIAAAAKRNTTNSV